MNKWRTMALESAVEDVLRVWKNHDVPKPLKARLELLEDQYAKVLKECLTEQAIIYKEINSFDELERESYYFWKFHLQDNRIPNVLWVGRNKSCVGIGSSGTHPFPNGYWAGPLPLPMDSKFSERGQSNIIGYCCTDCGKLFDITHKGSECCKNEVLPVAMEYNKTAHTFFTSTIRKTNGR